MRLKIKLYGTLGRRFPGYRHSEGLEVEIPDGATVGDLLAMLEIPESQKAVVAVEGRILKADDTIPGTAHARIFQPIHGG